jgi:pimeloyl-ACP methyl ester carboxylesterase/DNA-binding CsgD family transcriptional regulator
MGTQAHLHFLNRPDTGQIAYTIWGTGVPLVRPPGWISHQGLFVQRPEDRLFAEALAASSPPWMEVDYDPQGTGLSSHERTDFSFEGMIAELEAVVDHLELPTFALLCGSVAAMPAIAYTVRHPQRVSRLIFVNAAARGASFNIEHLVTALNAIVAVVEAEWDIGFEALAQLLSPAAPAEVLQLFTRSRWEGTYAGTALALWAALRAQDVRDLLPQITVPTLVIHSRGDRLAHFAAGVELASNIPNARFLAVEGSTHSLFRGAEAPAVRQTILEFLAEQIRNGDAAALPTASPALPPLSHQQLRVLQLLAEGKGNREIAATLVLSERTVERHIANLYAKIHAHNRAEATVFALNLARA